MKRADPDGLIARNCNTSNLCGFEKNAFSLTHVCKGGWGAFNQLHAAHIFRLLLFCCIVADGFQRQWPTSTLTDVFASSCNHSLSPSGPKEKIIDLPQRVCVGRWLFVRLCFTRLIPGVGYVPVKFCALQTYAWAAMRFLKVWRLCQQTSSCKSGY